MAVSNIYTIFGVHQMTAISRSDGTIYGTLKALGDATIDHSREAIKLFGGSNPHPWSTQYGNISGDMSITIREFKPFLWTLTGNTITNTPASATGTVSALTNIGSAVAPVMSGTTGIASVAVTSGNKANLKAGRYIVKAESASTVSVYAYTDVDGGAGAALPALDDTNLLTASPFLTITTGAAVTTLANLGIQFVGGSGTIGMTVGATAYFDITPVNTGGSVRITDNANPVPVSCSIVVASQKQTNGNVDYTYLPNCTVDAVPQGYGEKKFTEGDLKISVNYDAVLGYSWQKDWVVR
jgi:hypothetical protein